MASGHQKITLVAQRTPVAQNEAGARELAENKLRDLRRNKELIGILQELLGKREHREKSIKITDHVLMIRINGYQRQIDEILNSAERILGERIRRRAPSQNYFSATTSRTSKKTAIAEPTKEETERAAS